MELLEIKTLPKTIAPLDFERDRFLAARKVNEFLGMMDGGNLSIAEGRVLYPQEQTKRRLEVINVPDCFYED